MGFLKSEIMRVVKSKSIYICFGVLLLGFCFPIIKLISMFGLNYDWNYVFLSSHGFGSETLVPLIVPIIVCIPYCSSFYEDISTGYINNICSRISFKKYILVKIGMNLLIPVVLITINIILSFVICNVLFKNSISDLAGVISQNIFLELISSGNIISYLSMIIITSIVFSGIFTSVGITSSLFIKNKYISVALPFLIYVVLGVIALSLDKIEYHLGTIMTAYLYSNEIIIKSVIIGGGIIILTNVIFYFFSMKEER